MLPVAQPARKERMLALLGGAMTGQRTPAGSYAQTRRMASPQTYRPRPSDPAAQLTQWVQAALCAVLGVALPLSGVVDAATRAALLQLQREAGLPQTGAIDGQTLQWLQAEVGLPAPGYHSAAPPWLREPAVLRPAAPAAPPGRGDDPKAGQDPLVQPDATGTAHDAPASAAPDGEQAAAAAHSLWRAGEGSPSAPQAAALARLLQREAVQGAMTLAFSREWLAAQAGDRGAAVQSALLAHALGWWAAAQAIDGAARPPWLRAVEQQAQSRPDEAVAAIRAAWLAQRPQ